MKIYQLLLFNMFVLFSFFVEPSSSFRPIFFENNVSSMQSYSIPKTTPLLLTNFSAFESPVKNLATQSLHPAPVAINKTPQQSIGTPSEKNNTASTVSTTSTPTLLSAPKSIISASKIEQTQLPQKIDVNTKQKIIRYNNSIPKKNSPQQNISNNVIINSMTDSITTYVATLQKQYTNLAANIPEIFPSYTIESLTGTKTMPTEIIGKIFVSSSPTVSPHDLVNLTPTSQWNLKINDTRSYLPNLYMGMQLLNKILPKIPTEVPMQATVSLQPNDPHYYAQLDPTSSKIMPPGTTIDNYVEYLSDQFKHTPNKILSMFVYAYCNDPATDRSQPIQIEDILKNIDPKKFNSNELKPYEQLYLTIRALEGINNKPQFAQYLDTLPADQQAAEFLPQIKNALSSNADADILLLAAGFNRTDFANAQGELSQEFLNSTDATSSNQIGNIEANLYVNYPSYEAYQQTPNEQNYQALELDYINITKNIDDFAQKAQKNIKSDKNSTYFTTSNNTQNFSVQILNECITFQQQIDALLQANRPQQLMQELLPTADLSIEQQLTKLDAIEKEFTTNIAAAKQNKTTTLKQNKTTTLFTNHVTQIFTAVRKNLTTIKVRRDMILEDATQTGNSAEIIATQNGQIQAIEKIIPTITKNYPNVTDTDKMINQAVTIELQKKVDAFVPILQAAQNKENIIWNSVSNKNKATATLLQQCINNLNVENNSASIITTLKNLINQNLLDDQQQNLENIDFTTLPDNQFKTNLDQKTLQAIDTGLQKIQSNNATINNIVYLYLVTFEEMIPNIEQINAINNFIETKMVTATSVNNSQNRATLSANINALEQLITSIQAGGSAAKKITEYNANIAGKNNIEQLSDTNWTLENLEYLKNELEIILDGFQTVAPRNLAAANFSEATQHIIAGNLTAAIEPTMDALTNTPGAINDARQQLQTTIQSNFGPYWNLLTPNFKQELKTTIEKYMAEFIVLTLLGGGVIYYNGQAISVSDQDKKQLQQQYTQAFISDIVNAAAADLTGADMNVISSGNIQAIGTSIVSNKLINTFAPGVATQNYNNTPSNMEQFEQKYAYIFQGQKALPPSSYQSYQPVYMPQSQAPSMQLLPVSVPTKTTAVSSNSIPSYNDLFMQFAAEDNTNFSTSAA